MSRAADLPFVGINWGSSAFRAYRIAADGTLLDRFTEPAGIASLDRAGMARQIAHLVARWPDHGTIYASGMVGSNVGWQEVPYAACPAGIADVAAAAVEVDFDGTPVTIIPGLACRREADGGLDILRGEEMEIFGLLALEGMVDGIVGLPGTHTKWARIHDAQILEFATSMSGEIFDRLTAQGLLSSIVQGDAVAGAIFHAAVDRAYERRLGLGTLLFGVRASVIRGELTRTDAASALRGLLIGSDIADAVALFPGVTSASLALIGNSASSVLHGSALSHRDITSRILDAEAVCVAGFRAIHAASAYGTP